jgi:hypothetical protein
MKTCKKMTVLVSRILDGDFDEKISALVAEHLECCPECFGMANRLRKQRDLMLSAKPQTSVIPLRVPYEIVINPAPSQRMPAFSAPRYAWAAILVIAIGLTFASLISFMRAGHGSISRAGATITASMAIASDQASSLNVPLGALCYYESKKRESPPLIEYHAIELSPLSIYNPMENSTVDYGYASPFFNEGAVIETNQHNDFQGIN